MATAAATPDLAPSPDFNSHRNRQQPPQSALSFDGAGELKWRLLRDLILSRQFIQLKKSPICLTPRLRLLTPKPSRSTPQANGLPVTGGPRLGTMDAAERAAAAARKGFASGATRGYGWRQGQLRAVVRMVEEKEADIMAALRTDLDKPELESYLHEISLAKKSAEFALANLKKWMAPEKVPTGVTTFPSSAHIVSEPLGTVLIISSWNYPFLLSLDPVIGAIAAGNAVVLKPSELAAATSSLFVDLFEEYLDDSCIKVVEGGIPETTALLEQKWDKIFYTGSGKVARIVMAAAAKHLTPVALELGGKCPMIVDSTVDLHVVAKRICVGKWGSNCGQACVAPDYLITTKDIAPKLVDLLKRTLDRFYGKDPLESKDLSRIVNSNHFNRLIHLLEDEKVEGKIVHGGQHNEKLLKIAPTLLLDVPADSLLMKEEIFGPILPIITVDTMEDGFAFVNSLPKPLAAYIFTNNKKLEAEFIETVPAGGMLINDTILQFANPYLPFGGVGESGFGKYHGKFSFDVFSNKKGVLSRGYFLGETRARYPPYTPAKQRILRGLLDGSLIALILALLGFPKD